MFTHNRPVPVPSLALSVRAVPAELPPASDDWRTRSAPLRLADPAVAVVGLLLAGAVAWLRMT